MGHTRIGRLRRSLKWKEVVLSFCAGADFDKLAGDILQAAKDNLNEQNLTQDASYQKAVYLLVQMGIGAQSKDFIGHMHAIGIDLTPNPSVQELLGKISEAVDDAAWQQPGTKCDLGEFAKLGLVNAITHVAHLEKDVNPESFLWCWHLWLYNTRFDCCAPWFQREDSDVYAMGTSASYSPLGAIFARR